MDSNNPHTHTWLRNRCFIEIFRINEIFVDLREKKRREKNDLQLIECL